MNTRGIQERLEVDRVWILVVFKGVVVDGISRSILNFENGENQGFVSSLNSMQASPQLARRVKTINRLGPMTELGFGLE